MPHWSWLIVLRATEPFRSDREATALWRTSISETYADLPTSPTVRCIERACIEDDQGLSDV